jgi:hypothetical protein
VALIPPAYSVSLQQSLPTRTHTPLPSTQPRPRDIQYLDLMPVDEMIDQLHSRPGIDHLPCIHEYVRPLQVLSRVSKLPILEEMHQ